MEILENKMTEATAKENEIQYKVLFDQAPLGIALVDSLTGQILKVNSKFANIVGRTQEEMLKIDWMSITHPDDIQEDLDNISLLVKIEEYMKVLGVVLEVCIFPARFVWALNN